MTPTLHLSKEQIRLVLVALTYVPLNHPLIKEVDVVKLQDALLNEHQILREHTCKAYRYDCPTCTRDNGNR